MVLEDESSDDHSSPPYMHSSSTDGLNEVLIWPLSLCELLQVPFSIEDPYYKGLELDVMSPCEKHVMASKRLVAFEGTDTGRRFLACAQPTEGNINCGFVEWVDHQWPPTMQNALLKLWAMVEDAKSARVNDNLENSFTIHHLTEEKNKLEANYDKLVQDSAITYQQEVRKELIDDMKAKMAIEMAKKDAETQQLTQKYEVLLNLTRAQATVIQNLKLNKMKERQVLTEASMNLELKNAELTKCQEKLTQEKLELKLQVADLLKGNKKHIEEKWQLEFQNEKLKEKFRGIQTILEK
ncbi:hypothetical protein VPH35_027916 [Triticum aestivum]